MSTFKIIFIVIALLNIIFTIANYIKYKESARREAINSILGWLCAIYAISNSY